jgi:integrase
MGVFRRLGKDGKEIWYIDYYADGKRVREAIGSKTAAKNALAVRQADVLRGEFRFKKEKKIRFEDFMKEFIEYAKIHKRSWGRDETSLNHFLKHFKGLFLSRISPALIEKYIKERLDKKIKPSTINRELITLKRFFTVAKKLGKFYSDNPVKEIDSLEVTQYVMRVLDRDEIKRLIDASSGYLKAIVITALGTAMRKGEILGLRWNDIDFIENYIYIKQTKSNVMRKVPMNSIVREALKGLKREGDFVFQSSKTGTHFRDFFRSFKSACKNAGIHDFRFHDLRHTSASLMVMAGIDLVTVSQLLGHSSITMTLKYSHPTPENKRRAVDALASALRPESREKMDTFRTHEGAGKSATTLLSERKAS